jgi:hypothetical protein
MGGEPVSPTPILLEGQLQRIQQQCRAAIGGRA